MLFQQGPQVEAGELSFLYPDLAVNDQRLDGSRVAEKEPVDRIARARAVQIGGGEHRQVGALPRFQGADVVFAAQAAGGQNIRLAMDLEPAEVITRQAIPCGLIVNELVTNSLKHAFRDGKGGEVRLDLKRNPDASVRIQVSDTGPGISGGDAAKSSLGLQLVGDLAKQLRGTLEIGPKAVVSVTFVPLSDDVTSPTSGAASSEAGPSRA